jgi:O-antigen/teichoic acid export membrane protein
VRQLFQASEVSLPLIPQRLKHFMRTTDPRVASLRLAVTSSTASKLVRAFTQTAIAGLAIRSLGPESYGVWLTVLAGLGWLSWGQAGLVPGLVNAIARAEGNRNATEQGVYFTTAFTVTAAAAIAIFLVFQTVLVLSPQALAVPANSGTKAQISLGYIQLGLILGVLRLPLGMIESAYVGLQKIHLLRNFDIAAQIVCAGIALALFWASAPPLLFLIGTGLAAECGVLAAGLYLVLKLRPHFFPTRNKFDLRASRDLFGTSLGYFVIQVAGYLVAHGGTLILAAYHGPAAVPIFALTIQLYGTASGLWTMFVTSLWGAIGEARARGEWRWIARVRHHLVLGAMVLSLGFSLILAFHGAWILRVWSGVEFDADPAFFIVIAAYCSVFTWTVLHAHLLTALCVVWPQTWAAIANGMLVFVLGLFFIPKLAASGLAMALLLGCALSTAWAYPYMLRKTVRENGYAIA